MKISEISTDKAAGILCEVSGYVFSILTDENLIAEFKRKIGDDASKKEIMSFGADKISKILPILLKTHKKDVFGILAALNDTTPGAIAKQNFITTAAQIKEIVQDEDLIDFFRSCAPGAKM